MVQTRSSSEYNIDRPRNIDSERHKLAGMYVARATKCFHHELTSIKSSDRNARESSLLRLPLEIQLEIYKEVLTGFHLRITRRRPGPEDPIHGAQCYITYQPPLRLSHRPLRCLARTIQEPLYSIGDHEQRGLHCCEGKVLSYGLALSKTCHYLHQITIPMIYSNNIFLFGTPAVVRKWATSLSKAQLGAVKMIVPCPSSKLMLGPQQLHGKFSGLEKICVLPSESREKYEDWIEHKRLTVINHVEVDADHAL